MPYWYLPAPEPPERPLLEALEAEGINYIDLFSIYAVENDVSLSSPRRGGEAAAGERAEASERNAGDPSSTISSSSNSSSLPQFFQRDSHWTNAGAYPAYKKIMANLNLNPDIPPLELTDAQATARDDHIGDIDALLYPTASKPETDYYYQLPAYAYFSDDKSVEASTLATINPEGKGTLLMYRDSFANAFIPFFSATFNKAYYSKLLPYDLAELERYQPDVVLVESAQRLTLNFSANPPAFPGPVVNLDSLGAAGATDTIETTAVSATILKLQQDGPYIVASGILAAELADEQTRVYLRVTGPDGQSVTREAFLTTARLDTDKAAAVQPAEAAAEASQTTRTTQTSQTTKTTQKAQTTDFGYKIFLPYSPERLQGSTLDVIITTLDNFQIVASREYTGEE
jgi:hypothetical protein